MELDTYKVLFVCLGNICRSPSAEAVFRHLVEQERLDQHIEIDSAGILSYHEGNPSDARMIRHAAKRGIQLTSISRPVVAEDFEAFDLIIGMDNSNMHELENMAVQQNSGATDKLFKMTDFSVNSDYDVVPDPYYGGEEGFELVLDLLEDACEGLLKYIRTKTGI